MAQDDEEGGKEGFGSRFLSGLKGMILEDEVPARRAPPEPDAPTGVAPAAAPKGNPGHPAPGTGFVPNSAPAPMANSPMYANLMFGEL